MKIDLLTPFLWSEINIPEIRVTFTPLHASAILFDLIGLRGHKPIYIGISYPSKISLFDS